MGDKGETHDKGDSFDEDLNLDDADLSELDTPTNPLTSDDTVMVDATPTSVAALLSNLMLPPKSN